MQESNKPTNEEAFWKSPQEGVEVGLEHLAEDKELEVSQVKAKFRHRLVGAVVLVAALATVLPIFFEEPAIQSDRHAETKIPPITKEPFYKMELPVNNRPAVSMPADQSALKDLSKPNVVKDAPEARPTPELDQKQKDWENRQKVLSFTFKCLPPQVKPGLCVRWRAIKLWAYRSIL